jgi:hypothetical protein
MPHPDHSVSLPPIRLGGLCSLALLGFSFLIYYHKLDADILISNLKSEKCLAFPAASMFCIMCCNCCINWSCNTSHKNFLHVLNDFISNSW